MKLLPPAFIVTVRFQTTNWLLTIFLILFSVNLSAQSTLPVSQATNSIVATAPGEAQALLVSVYPNPVNNVLTIASKKEAIQGLEMLNLEGKKIQEATIDNSPKVTVNLSSLDAGDYVLKVITESGVVTKRFTKED